MADSQITFPSNGKAYSQVSEVRIKTLLSVSIPFKRESVSRESSISSELNNCFNSLQTGKRIYSDETANKVSIPFKRESVSQVCAKFELTVWILEFQFPSNGKAYLKSPTAKMDSFSEEIQVSIPFKRESVSQV